VTLLVHELPGLLAEKQLTDAARAGAAAADAVIFPAGFVRDRFAAHTGLALPDAMVLPQGSYRAIAFSARDRAGLRARLGLADATVLVVGAGYGDLRKGFDLFLQAWRAARRQRADVLFCWLGELDPAMRAYLAGEIAAAEATGGFRLAGFQPDMAAWLSAADAFALTSREDPFPTVALEAMSAGLPVAAFAGSGGMPEAIAALAGGAAVPMGDADAFAGALLRLAATAARGRTKLARRAHARFDFAAYAERLLACACHGLASISAVVPNYNYARYLDERLASIFAQSHPVAEVVLLDDASTDGSLAVARRVAEDWRRELRIETAAANSGSPFRQWRRAAELARGEFVWIAEADDGADPALLATLAGLMQAQPGIDLAFCDSRAVDAEGRELWPSYRAYCAGAGAAALSHDGIFPARDFARRFLAERNLILNVSAVLWRRSALLAALERCGAELDEFHVAGDWRLYLELMAASDGAVGYVAAALNTHRRHAASVTAAGEAGRQVAEIARLHRVVRTRLAADTATRRRQAAYRKQLSGELSRSEAPATAPRR